MQRKYVTNLILVLVILVCLFTSLHFASAHEVYVLDQKEINVAQQAPTPDFISTIRDQFGLFVTWGLKILVLLIAAFLISFNKFVRKLFAPYLIWLKKYAPHVSQFVLGIAIAAAGYFRALFGIEIPFSEMFGKYDHFIAIIFVILGLMLMIGLLPRISGLFLSVIFILSAYHLGFYMLTYLLYFGEALTIVIFGGAYSIHNRHFLSHHISKKLHETQHNYKFLIIRITFGISLIYASLYSKLIHGALALETVTKFHLTNYFHFTPLFLVLGAMIVEVLLGLAFASGFLVRFASIFFLTMLTMSLIFFGETVWPHIILIGTAIVVFMHGYDKYTVMSAIQRDKLLEPVL